VRKLNEEIVKVLNQSDVRRRLEDLGFEIVGSTPEELDEVIRADLQKWPRIAKEAESR
jgi:tripartite-type tricarboxylate transporter receptor subunit TctC